MDESNNIISLDNALIQHPQVGPVCQDSLHSCTSAQGSGVRVSSPKASRQGRTRSLRSFPRLWNQSVISIFRMDVDLITAWRISVSVGGPLQRPLNTPHTEKKKKIEFLGGA